MARGWESKSVESQQEDVSRGGGAAGAGPARAGRGEADWDAHRRRRVLTLSKARVSADLERSRTPAQRAMLERALADLTAEIESLEPPSSS